MAGGVRGTPQESLDFSCLETRNMSGKQSPEAQSMSVNGGAPLIAGETRKRSGCRFEQHSRHATKKYRDTINCIDHDQGPAKRSITPRQSSLTLRMRAQSGIVQLGVAELVESLTEEFSSVSRGDATEDVRVQSR